MGDCRLLAYRGLKVLKHVRPTSTCMFGRGIQERDSTQVPPQLLRVGNRGCANREVARDTLLGSEVQGFHAVPCPWAWRHGHGYTGAVSTPRSPRLQYLRISRLSVCLSWGFPTEG